MNRSAHADRSAIPSAIPNHSESSVDLPRIVVLDDEVNILSALQMGLEEWYSVFATTNPEEAIQQTLAVETHILMCDQRMPKRPGWHVLAEARKRAPDVRRVLMTGFSDFSDIVHAINEGGIHQFISKPWKLDSLLEVLGELVAVRNLEKENVRLRKLTEEQNLRFASFNATLQSELRKHSRKVDELNERLCQTLNGTMRLIADVAERHSPLAGSHGARVAELCVEVGKRLGFDDEQLFQLHAAGLLHDIGKIDNGDLSASKRAELQGAHPEQGARLLAGVKTLAEAATYVHHHHEAYNGHGYPDGLAGNAIPIGARIIAVANAYDHALNQRKNLGHVSPLVALEAVAERSGVTLDSDIVAILTSIVRQGAVKAASPDVIDVSLRDLRVGMKLDLDLRSTSGVMLVKAGTRISQRHLDLLASRSSVDPVARIRIHRMATHA